MNRVSVIRTCISVAAAALFAGPAALTIGTSGAYAASHLPVAAQCVGNGGWTTDPTTNQPVWQFSPSPSGDPTGLNANYCGAETPNPNNPQDPRYCITSDPNNCTILQGNTDPFATIYWLHYGVLASQAGPTGSLSWTLTGTGSFACGSGALSGTGMVTQWASYDQYSITWSVASFSNGVGQMVGTATDRTDGSTKALGGTITIDDGASRGSCDDSNGAERVVVALTMS